MVEIYVAYASRIGGEFYKAGFFLRELIVRQNLYRTYIIRKNKSQHSGARYKMSLLLL